MKLAKDVLSVANKTNCVKLLSSYKSNEFFSSKTKKRAAVLVPLCTVDDELCLLYTIRALHLKINGGDIAFPGGMFNDSDGCIENTALREAHEEVGIDQESVNVWGKGPEIHREDMKVTPVLGYIGNLDINNLKINSSEVKLAFSVSLENLCSPQNFHITKFRNAKNFIYQTPVYLGNDKKIWGLTAYITHIVLSCLVPEIYKKNINFHPSVSKIYYAKNKNIE